MDECTSSPCQNGAACSDSFTDSTVAIASFKCTCVAGFANGTCGYLLDESLHTAPNFIQYCDITEGTCDMDVNECASHPCQRKIGEVDTTDSCVDSNCASAGCDVEECGEVTILVAEYNSSLVSK